MGYIDLKGSSARLLKTTAATASDAHGGAHLAMRVEKDASGADVASAKRQGEETLLLIFVRNQLRVALALPLIALLFSLANLSWSNVWAVFTWLVLVLIAQGIQVIVCHAYEIHSRGKRTRFSRILRTQTDWNGLILASELLYALTWVLPLFSLWDAGNTLQHMFMIAVLMVVAAVRILIAFSFLPIVLAGSGVITLAIVLRCLLAGEMFYIWLAAIVLITEIFFIQLSRRLQETAQEMLMLKAEREGLIDKLAAARDRAEEARRRAERANRAKSMFLANMSHELRTPLNAIMGFSEIIEKELFGPVNVPQYRDYAHDIRESGQYLLSLINDILDLSRIEAGRFELREEAVNLARQVEECIRLVAFRATERGLKITTDIPQDLPALKADPRALRQILLNLLSNAVKFTDRGGRISVRARRAQGGGLCISVIDNGIGIDPAELADVQQAFARGKNALDGAVEGAGLGLAIVHGLARLHGASVHFDSRRDEGTTVHVIFPPERVAEDETDLGLEAFLDPEETIDDNCKRLLDALDARPA
ncbi:HAMP domain-containing sensor histidine kinase [Thermopetrobacter sp. TC1]|uniref:sensor histidine kinase n=1 Tax=Thermopetrobacter sp. TC1 TaxID=1495045 RepID=UPI00068C6332|nr:HAMP domain-containing sensor histidine kinase [Thermopetrobacter sp. TC1]